MTRISREEAITKICKKKISVLSIEERESYILDWWGIDEEDTEFSILSAELQQQIVENEEPPDDSDNCKYDELIQVALTTEFRGVTNSYIAECMAITKLGFYEVYGDVEKLEVCPCCQYRTLDSRGEYDICGLCNWEDSGVEEDNQYSGPNHMTLGEAKVKLLKSVCGLPLNKWIKA